MPTSRPTRPALSRRDLLKRSGAALATLPLIEGLAACGDSGSGSGDGSVTLGVSPDLPPFIKSELRAYAKSSGRPVKIRLFPSDTDQYFDRIRTQLEAGSSDVDVFAGDISWRAQLAANGWIEDLGSQFAPADRKAFLPATVEAATYDGKLVGVPFFTDVGLLYYRKDLLARSGYSAPPQTWDELEEMAKKVMRDQKVRNGLVFTGATYEGGTLLGLEFIGSAGGRLIDGKKVNAGDANVVAGLARERRLITDGIAPAAVASYQEDQITGQFLAGNAVFMRNWAYVFGLLPDKSQSKLSPGQVGITSVPVERAGVTSVNFGGGWNLYVNAASKNQDAAYQLVQFLAAAKQQKHLAVAGSYLPTRTALYDDAALIRKLPAVAEAKAQIAQTATPPPSPFYHDLSAVLAKQFNSCLRGASSPAQTAHDIQQQAQSILSRSV